MKRNKSILLFLTLIFPVLIYLFLQGFGKNEFDIPVYFENGIENLIDGCLPSTAKPYRLDNEMVSEVASADIDDKITVFELGNTDSDHLRNNLYTFLEKYKDMEQVQLISFKTLKDTLFNESRYMAWKRYNLADSNLMRLGRCILQLDLNSQMEADSGLVLVDRKMQIRGYYDPFELKEVDRLNTEVFILLSK